MKTLFRRMARWLLSLSSAVAFVASAHAQLVPDGGTATLANLSNAFSGNVFVGTNAPFTLLVLSNNSLLTNNTGYIGFNANARSNEVRLVSDSARWLMGGSVVLGYNGAFNRLTVSNGAKVMSLSGTFSANSVFATNNVAIVTGAGSVWSNASDLDLGALAGGNRFEIRDGGWVGNHDGTMGFAANNRMLVTDANSVWSNRNDLIVGLVRGGNQLVISNGGKVFNRIGYLGQFTGGSNNVAVVTGAGSAWANLSDLYVGMADRGNQLVVSNGATVSFAGTGAVGVNSGAVSNRVTLIGSGSRWLGGAMSPLFVGSNSAFNQLIVSAGALVTGREAYVGLSGSTNTAVVTGAGSHWSNATFLTVGGFSAGNRLTIGIGGLVENQFGIIGSVSSANNNVVVVTDPGSTWNNRFSLDVGSSGSSSRLEVNNGGTVLAGGAGVFVGSGPLSANNRLVVNGGTLRATNAGGTAVLDVRRGAAVLNSGTMDADWLVLTNEPQGKFEFNGGRLITRGIVSTSTNLFSMVVGGTGATPATWDVRAGPSNHFLPGGLLVGSNSSFNQLLITNGALLTNISSILSSQPRANSNLVLLSGAGSAWSMRRTLAVGIGSANQLVVSNGARLAVHGIESSIGSSPGRDNAVVVTGAGSAWINAFGLFLGFSGPASRLMITNGGTVFTGDFLTMGVADGSTNNRIVVDGGTLRVTNAAGTGRLEIRRGTNVLNAGLVEVDRLVLMFTSGFFEFNGGTLKPGATVCDNGRIFTVGDETRVATLQLPGGTHAFTNGLLINNRGTLTGFGTVAGQLTVAGGGTLSPGDGLGTLTLTAQANLQGTTFMEVFKLGGSRFTDHVEVTGGGALIYGGSLTVSNVGVTAFAAGDTFKLFNAAAYAGSFISLNLPPLGPGLGWSNKLRVDGSIEVVAVPEPRFASITRVGTNVAISGTNGTPNASYTVLAATNVALPLSNWVSIATRQFDASGRFSFTNAIMPGIPQRFFRLRAP